MHRAIDKILSFIEGRERYAIFIDGRSGAGKTTLAEALRERLYCPVVHMDDFFLQPQQRTKERLAEPGGNVAYERVREEVLEPFAEGDRIQYRPYDCKTQSLLQPVEIENTGKLILEGAYCGHPKLWDYADVHIFMDIDAKEQLIRLKKRVGSERLMQFKERWIPLEEAYISYFAIDKKSELYFKN